MISDASGVGGQELGCLGSVVRGALGSRWERTVLVEATIQLEKTGIDGEQRGVNGRIGGCGTLRRTHLS
jgi:hypothetical protein